MISKLPENVKQSGASAVFTSGSVPDAILNWHTTKAHVWGKIVIHKGTATYEILTDPVERVELNSERPGFIEPEQPHRLIPDDGCEFQIQFFTSS